MSGLDYTFGVMMGIAVGVVSTVAGVQMIGVDDTPPSDFRVWSAEVEDYGLCTFASDARGMVLIGCEPAASDSEDGDKTDER